MFLSLLFYVNHMHTDSSNDHNFRYSGLTRIIFQLSLSLVPPGNGEISRREYVRTLSHRESPFIALIGSRRLVTKYARRLFASGDMNKDGVLSRVDAGIIYNNLDNNGNTFEYKKIGICTNIDNA